MIFLVGRLIGAKKRPRLFLSADEKASGKSAGATKQHNGRMGKVETSPVGVLLSSVNLKVAQGFWTGLEGKLFLPDVPVHGRVVLKNNDL